MIRVAAGPTQVYAAARHADLGRPWPIRVLMGIRALPAWPGTVLCGSQPVVEATIERRRVGAAAFTLIAEAPGIEFVLGIMGRFWTPTGGLVTANADRFREPPPAGLAQAVCNFHVERQGVGTVLSTETRVRCADAATRRQFARYWRVIRLGSGLIRRSMLRQIRTDAERSVAG